MNRRFDRTVVAFATGVGALLFADSAAAKELDFEQTFAASEGPAQAHYIATYRLGDSEHRLEVWRSGAARLKRRTDDSLETYVTRTPGDVDWSMSVLDLKRRIRTDVDRVNLARVGHITDWFAMAHSLARPVGSYRLNRIGAPKIARPPSAGTCRWYELAQATRRSKICWSEAQQIPLLITDANDVVQWRVSAIDSRPIEATIFVIADSGFVRNDANQDIKAD